MTIELKLQIDLNNPIEAQRALDIVKFALKSPVSERGHAIDEPGKDSTFDSQGFDRLPKLFTVTDVQGDRLGKSERNRANYSISKWIKDGVVRVFAVKKGRSGNVYEKISPK